MLFKVVYFGNKMSFRIFFDYHFLKILLKINGIGRFVFDMMLLKAFLYAQKNLQF